ncbi:phosphoribosylformylglycinamidine synthase subunit PurQ [Desulfosarcina ovata]|uniref:Phosphoribosylformylglycinamidine synthase n=1 Tax=Desulfosarcina ovata subsp. ovata TaxID=2752305 RepID=A0A5K8ALA2_9BACT|nr:phosphoribosylformylglycinamidine synthase subunit PurQ [Desulfosarcina ovata]BBO93491.1 phosphoribosylformylglycinamidine synthase [Desulfosarcina ovata subsp. ovata]
MSVKPNVLVLTGFGLNCDHETAYAFELAGAVANRVHINTLIGGDVRLDDFQILVFGGGFSWGDDHGAGVIQALRLKTNLGDRLLAFVAADKLVMGICNGFQTLVNLGLLPGIDGDYTCRSVALTNNDCGNFRDQWVHLAVNPDSPCIFTRGIETLDLPVRHGEGKFYADDKTIQTLSAGNQIALRYALPDGRVADGTFPHNPNGSLMDIAGICDPSGRVFGLMPHPEAYNHVTNHPAWTRRLEMDKRRGTVPPTTVGEGIRVFENAVAYFSG